jgi:hypothetical protein
MTSNASLAHYKGGAIRTELEVFCPLGFVKVFAVGLDAHTHEKGTGGKHRGDRTMMNQLNMGEVRMLGRWPNAVARL